MDPVPSLVLLWPQHEAFCFHLCHASQQPCSAWGCIANAPEAPQPALPSAGISLVCLILPWFFACPVCCPQLLFSSSIPRSGSCFCLPSGPYKWLFLIVLGKRGSRKWMIFKMKHDCHSFHTGICPCIFFSKTNTKYLPHKRTLAPYLGLIW